MCRFANASVSSWSLRTTPPAAGKPRKMAACCVATAAGGRSSACSPGFIISPRGHPLGILPREFPRDGAACLCRHPPEVFMRWLLVNQLQRKLDLPRSPRGFIDHSEPASAHHIRRQSEIHNVEHIKKLGAKLHNPQLIFPAPPKRRILNQAEIEILVPRPAKRISPQRPKSSAVRPGTSRHIDGN